MRRRNIKIVSLLMVLLMVMSMLAACGSKEEAPAEDAE